VRTIYKYPLLLIQAATGQSIVMPRGAEIRLVGVDPRGVSCIWAEIDPAPEIVKEQRTFWLYGTGHAIGFDGQGLKYVGSWVQEEFVWHLYEES
jgi:hypothetical protein